MRVPPTCVCVCVWMGEFVCAGQRIFVFARGFLQKDIVYGGIVSVCLLHAFNPFLSGYFFFLYRNSPLDELCNGSVTLKKLSI